LLKHYRQFVAKAYVTSCDYLRHREDFFWFITNVPFACTEGPAILTSEYVRRTLAKPDDDEVKATIGSGNIDDALVVSLAARLGVFIVSVILSPRLCRVEGSGALA
jgi:hypothetical protein